MVISYYSSDIFCRASLVPHFGQRVAATVQKLALKNQCFWMQWERSAFTLHLICFQLTHWCDPTRGTVSVWGAANGALCQSRNVCTASVLLLWHLTLIFFRVVLETIAVSTDKTSDVRRSGITCLDQSTSILICCEAAYLPVWFQSDRIKSPLL